MSVNLKPEINIVKFFEIGLFQEIFHEIFQGKKFHEILHHYLQSRTQNIQVVENFGPDLPILFKLQTAQNMVS